MLMLASHTAKISVSDQISISVLLCSYAVWRNDNSTQPKQLNLPNFHFNPKVLQCKPANRFKFKWHWNECHFTCLFWLTKPSCDSSLALVTHRYLRGITGLKVTIPRVYLHQQGIFRTLCLQGFFFFNPPPPQSISPRVWRKGNGYPLTFGYTFVSQKPPVTPLNSHKTQGLHICSGKNRCTDRERAREKEREGSSPRGCGAGLERWLPRGVIFYSLCPSVAWPGALGLTVSALNIADADSSEPWHTWEKGGGRWRCKTEDTTKEQHHDGKRNKKKDWNKIIRRATH